MIFYHLFLVTVFIILFFKYHNLFILLLSIFFFYFIYLSNLNLLIYLSNLSWKIVGKNVNLPNKGAIAIRPLSIVFNWKSHTAAGMIKLELVILIAEFINIKAPNIDIFQLNLPKPENKNNFSNIYFCKLSTIKNLKQKLKHKSIFC